MCNWIEYTGLHKFGKHEPYLFQEPFLHGSLLTDSGHGRLTRVEKQMAQRSYEMEKKMNITYSRPSYAAFYSKNSPYDASRASGMRYDSLSRLSF